MPEGKIKKLMDKGFGFIKTESEDLFFHTSNLNDVDFNSLKEGDIVTYTIGHGPKGLRAENVTLK